MGVDVRKVVENVREDLKASYRRNPASICTQPRVVIVRKGAEVEELGGLPPDKLAEWLASFHDKHGITDVVVGTMAMEYGAVCGVDGQPVVKKKAILVTGRNLSNGRTVVSVTYANEHRDYRTAEQIETEGQLPNPGVSSPDVTKAIMDDQGVIAGWLTGQLGQDIVYDSKEGNRCIEDPLIKGIVGLKTEGGA